MAWPDWLADSIVTCLDWLPDITLALALLLTEAAVVAGILWAMRYCWPTMLI